MKISLTFSIEVPAGTDPQQVLDVANRFLDDDDGLLCQWGNWAPGRAELTAAGDIATSGSMSVADFLNPPAGQMHLAVRKEWARPSGEPVNPA